MGFTDPIVGGVDKLIRRAIQSPNFVAGVSGWSINRDGTAQFNELTIVTAEAGAALLVYNGAAGLGNLIASISAIETVDSFGNIIPAGIFATQGTLQGMQLVNTLLTQCIIDAATIDSSLMSNSTISGGEMTETTITFDVNGGVLLCYAVTTTTITQTVAGAYQFTVPATSNSGDITCTGSGPGGNGGTNGAGGHGGGGPACSREPAYSWTPGSVIDYYVGKGGNNSPTGGGDGDDGEATFFDISNGGVVADGGNADGTPGAVSSNSISHPGGSGGTASSTGGAGGGGSAGATGAGGNGANNSGSGSVAGGAAGTGGGAVGGTGGAHAGNGGNGAAPGAAGGGAGDGSGTTSFDKTYTTDGTHSYQGSNGHQPNAKINDNGIAYHGGNSGDTYNGKAKTWCHFDWSQIQSDLAGVSLASTTVRLNNNHSWYNSGMTVSIGWDTKTSFGATESDPSSGSTDVHFDEGEQKFVTVGGLGTAFKNGTAKSITLFKNSSSLTYYGYFAGKNQSGPPQVRFQGSSGGTPQNSGTGADGKIIIKYTSAATIKISIAAVAGTDQFGNAYPAGMMVDGINTPLVGVDPVNGGPETWHSLGSPSATNFTSNHGRYRMTADGTVEFDIVLTGGTGGGTQGTYTYANTLPTAYRPALDRFFPLGAQGAWIAAGGRFPGLKVNADGSVNLHMPSMGFSGNIAGGTFRMMLD
jgi:hypothetical protein